MGGHSNYNFPNFSPACYSIIILGTTLQFCNAKIFILGGGARNWERKFDHSSSSSYCLRICFFINFFDKPVTCHSLDKVCMPWIIRGHLQRNPESFCIYIFWLLWLGSTSPLCAPNQKNVEMNRIGAPLDFRNFWYFMMSIVVVVRKTGNLTISMDHFFSSCHFITKYNIQIWK